VIKQPDVRPVIDDRYVLMEEYTYTWSESGALFRITVPRGFEYDGASVPRLLWGVTGLRPDGLIRAAALVHDFVYAFRGDLPPRGFEIYVDNSFWAECQLEIDRAWADRLFNRIMRESGVGRTRRWLAYSGVRAGGWLAWRKDTLL